MNFVTTLIVILGCSFGGCFWFLGLWGCNLSLFFSNTMFLLDNIYTRQTQSTLKTPKQTQINIQMGCYNKKKNSQKDKRTWLNSKVSKVILMLTWYKIARLLIALLRGKTFLWLKAKALDQVSPSRQSYLSPAQEEAKSRETDLRYHSQVCSFKVQLQKLAA